MNRVGEEIVQLGWHVRVLVSLLKCKYGRRELLCLLRGAVR